MPSALARSLTGRRPSGVAQGVVLVVADVVGPVVGGLFITWVPGLPYQPASIQ